MSLRLGDKIISGISRHTVSNANPLLSFKWFDHIVNSMEWLRADTFSWQSGDVYTSVYNLLVSEYQNGTEETEGSITFKRSPNGYKITTDESGVSALFNDTGVAWYYIIDTENRRFKLPRSKYNAYTSQIAIKGNGMSLGLTSNGTNIGTLGSATSGSLARAYPYQGTPALLPSTTSGTIIVSGDKQALGITTDPTKSGMVADLPTQELHLYFYVGEFSQTATEQTAGITSEVLNNKADKNEVWTPSSSTSAQKETIVGWGNPDNSSLIKIAGVQSYTAPSYGILYVPATGSGITMKISIDGVEVINFRGFGADGHTEGRWCATVIIGKGQTATFSSTSHNSKFVPITAL